jgi:glycosyltransferase involved in cell wall biosynthesis
MLEFYHGRYRGVDFCVLPHSFNEDVPPFAAPAPPGPTTSLILSGNITESCRDAALRVSRAVAQHGHSTLLLLSGTPLSHLEQMGMVHDKVMHGTVSRDVLLAELERADIVVLPHGFDGAASAVEYQTIFPTRTIEYLICRRPILAHALPDCFLTAFLQKHDCALVVDVPETSAVIAAIERLRNDGELRARLVRNALHTARMFHAPRVAATLRGYLALSDRPADTNARSTA